MPFKLGISLWFLHVQGFFLISHPIYRLWPHRSWFARTWDARFCYYSSHNCLHLTQRRSHHYRSFFRSVLHGRHHHVYGHLDNDWSHHGLSYYRWKSHRRDCCADYPDTLHHLNHSNHYFFWKFYSRSAWACNTTATASSMRPLGTT